MTIVNLKIIRLYHGKFELVLCIRKVSETNIGPDTECSETFFVPDKHRSSNKTGHNRFLQHAFQCLIQSFFYVLLYSSRN